MATLKEQALLQHIGELAMMHADALGNYRVQLTEVTQALEELRQAPALVNVPDEETENVQK